MTECEGYQVAIEMKLHGAQESSGASVRLEAHLASCVACQEFEMTAKNTEEAMRSSAIAVSQTVDWDRLRARIGKLKRRSFLFALGILSGALIAGSLNWIDAWLIHQPVPDWKRSLLLVACVLATCLPFVVRP